MTGKSQTPGSYRFLTIRGFCWFILHMHCHLCRPDTKCFVFLYHPIVVVLAAPHTRFLFILFAINCVIAAIRHSRRTPQKILALDGAHVETVHGRYCSGTALTPDDTRPERRTTLTAHAPNREHAALRTPRAALALNGTRPRCYSPWASHAPEGAHVGKATFETIRGPTLH